MGEEYHVGADYDVKKHHPPKPYAYAKMQMRSLMNDPKTSKAGEGCAGVA